MTLRPLLSLLLLAALAVPGWSQSVTLPKEINSKANRPIFVAPEVDGDDLKWEIPEGLDDWVSMLPPAQQKNFGYTKIFYGDPGVYVIRAWTAKVVDGKAKLSDVASCVITIGDKPVPPVPPGPDPPKPVPPVPPIPVSGFRVLFVYETSANHTQEQLNILNSTKITEYLNRKTVKDGNQPGWRRWDKDIQVFRESSANMKLLWEAVKPKIGTLPALVIAVDKDATVHPLPATEAATLELLRKHGGD